MDAKEIKEIIREEIRSTVKELMKELKEEMSKEIDEKYKGKIDDMREEINDVREDQTRVNKEIKTEINSLWDRMHKMEEYSRHENVIIRGIRYKEEETVDELISKVIDVAKKLKTDLNRSEISTTHRLPTKSRNTPPPVIVRVTNRWKKEELIAASKQYRLKDIFITHQLTPYKYRLLKEAIELKRKEVVKYVWTAGNRIMVRRNEGEEATQIVNVQSLMKLGWNDEGETASQKTQDDGETDLDGSDAESKKSEDRTERTRRKQLKQQSMNAYAKTPLKNNVKLTKPTTTVNTRGKKAK